MNFETSRQFDKLVFKIKDSKVKARLKTVIEKVLKFKTLTKYLILPRLLDTLVITGSDSVIIASEYH